MNYKHVQRNALMPPVTVIAIHFGWLLIGPLVIENEYILPRSQIAVLHLSKKAQFVTVMGINKHHFHSLLVAGLFRDVIRTTGIHLAPAGLLYLLIKDEEKPCQPNQPSL
jgi:ABC-type dipeptide/oligopeptide/nickel transport system permease component